MYQSITKSQELCSKAQRKVGENVTFDPISTECNIAKQSNLDREREGRGEGGGGRKRRRVGGRGEERRGKGENNNVNLSH